MNVALHSNDFRADGISFTLSRNPGFVEDTVELTCTSDAVSASDRLDTVPMKQIANNIIHTETQHLTAILLANMG